MFEDDLLNLGDEETLGNTSDNAIKEYTSPFTDINYSKNKIISAIDWMPDAKGVVAVACTDMASLDEQVPSSLLPSPLSAFRFPLSAFGFGLGALGSGVEG